MILDSTTIITYGILLLTLAFASITIYLNHLSKQLTKATLQRHENYITFLETANQESHTAHKKTLDLWDGTIKKLQNSNQLNISNLEHTKKVLDINSHLRDQLHQRAQENNILRALITTLIHANPSSYTPELNRHYNTTIDAIHKTGEPKLLPPASTSAN